MLLDITNASALLNYTLFMKGAMYMNMRNADKVKQLEKDLNIRGRQLSAKNVQMQALQEKVYILEAKTRAAELYITALLNMMNTNSVTIMKSDLKRAMNTRLKIDINDDSFSFEINSGVEQHE